jgi:Tfp pilus tip-associated adhesin PilY1
MKKQLPIITPIFLLWSLTFPCYVNTAWAETAASYNSVPPFITSGAAPLVMLVMGRDHKLYYEAYNDASDLDNDGSLETHYKPSIEYYGYFDSYKYYEYNTSLKRFEPKGNTTNKKAPEGSYWSGDFLNYLTMARIDVMRKVLYGGYRSTDTASETVLERAYITNDAHCWGKEYKDFATDGYLISDYTPYAEPTAGTRHLFASGSVVAPSDVAYAPLLRVKNNSADRISKWVTTESGNGILGTTRVGTPDADFEVRVQVGVTLLPNLKAEKIYTNTTTGVKVYKPIGLLQRYGESGAMQFGLMTGSYQNHLSGGVLRKNIGPVTNEIDQQTGQFLYKTNSALGGIIKTIDNFKLIGFNHSTHSWDKTIYSRPIIQGENYMWGNPMGEIMYETLRYFNGTTSTPAFTESVLNKDDRDLDLPLETWKNPYAAAASGGLGYAVCAKPFMLVLSDINPSYDTNQLPGIYSGFADATPFTDTFGTFNAENLANTIFAGEPDAAGSHYIGQSNALYDTACSAKTVSGLGSSRGLCPEEPTKLGGYYSAAAAYYGKISDINTATSVQNVTTYAVALASPMPRIEIPMVSNTITLVPFAKTVYSTLANNNVSPTGTFQPTCAIVDFYVEEITPTHGKFTVTYEHSEQGADYDLDATITYEYTKSLNTVNVKIQSENIPGGNTKQHFGYIISGTSADGVYLDIKNVTQPDADDQNYFLDTPNNPAPLPNLKERTFTASTDTAATLLNNPLYYAAKWGGFDDKNGNQKPDLQDEWDKDHDGVPDTYFYVINPLKLEEKLNQSFADILSRTTSGTAASVISGSRSGEGAIYQSVFYPEYGDNANNKISWAGSVHASFVDDLGRMREDTPNAFGVQNHILDEKDKIIVFGKDGSGNLVIEKYGLVGAVAEVTKVTLPDPPSSSLAGKYFLLNAVGEEFYVWFTVDGGGSNPLLQGVTGIPVALISTDSANDVAIKTAAAIDAYGAFVVPVPGAASITITITNTVPGDVANATPVTSGVTLEVTTQGAGETTHLDFTGNAEQIKYLWNSNTWLNSISDANIVTQRTYNSADQKRYIFTFIDANQDKINDGEQLEFSATALPALVDLTDDAKIYPYIPVNSDSEALPVWVDDDDKRDDFLKNQTQRVINFTRGQDQGSTAITGGTLPAFRSRKLDLDNNGSLETTWRLGDIVHSSPTVVNKPREALHLLYKDSTYATFAAKYGNRRTVLYTGANDGMLHAFNGGFYEDRFDVYPGSISPAVPDGIKDVEYLLQPKKITSASGVTPVVWGPDTSFTARPLGAELWAYVPYNLLPHLYWPTEPGYAHVYFADLKPRIFDAKIFTPDTDHPGGWGTVLVGGMRLGGGKINVDMNRLDGNVDHDDRIMTSAYYILDITNPEVAPTVLAEINFPELGYTTCYPTVATIKDKVEVSGSPNRWFLIFGSGPAESDGSPGTKAGDSLSKVVSKQSAKLYVVDLEEMVKNKVLKTLDTHGELTAESPYYYQSFDGDKNAFISDPITVDYDLDYKADAVYFGTQSYDAAATAGTEWGGKLRRIVMKKETFPTIDPTDPSTWDGDSVLIDLEKSAADPTTGIYQPITAAPSVGLDPDGNDWIYFGTGRYFIRDDKDIATQQTFYGIKEPRGTVTPFANTYAEVLLADMYNSTTIEVNASTGLVSGDTIPPSGANITWGQFLSNTKSYAGWYYNFTDGLERNVGQAALFGDLLTFTSYIPSNDICTYEGSSYLYALYYLTGTAPSQAVIHDSTNPNPVYYLKRVSLGTGLVAKPSIHVGRKDGSTVFVQTSEGAILTLDEENPGQSHSGRTSWGYK